MSAIATSVYEDGLVNIQTKILIEIYWMHEIVFDSLN